MFFIFFLSKIQIIFNISKFILNFYQFTSFHVFINYSFKLTNILHFFYKEIPLNMYIFKYK